MTTKDLTTSDVAWALQVNRVTVQRLLHSGKLKGYQVGRVWRTPATAINEFRSRNTEVKKSSRLQSAQEFQHFSATEFAEWERLLLD